jgi:intein/homing endonuclease
MEPLSDRKALNRKTLKEDYFDNWSDNMAYDLGYICADGWVEGRNNGSAKLGLKCASEDESIILGLRERIGSNHSVKRIRGFNDGRGYFTRPQTKLSVTNSRVVASLMRRGVEQTKSRKDPPFIQVPSLHLPHFVRGYFDGDGSAYDARRSLDHASGVYFTLAGTFTFLLQMKERIVAELHVRDAKLIQNGEDSVTFKVFWGALDDVKRIYHWIYPDVEGLPFLRRKREILELVVKRGS